MCEQETAIADTIKSYSTDSITKQKNVRIQDMIDMSLQLSANINEMVALRTKLNDHIRDVTLQHLDDLILNTRIEEGADLTKNQEMFETDYALQARSAGYVKVLTSLAKGYINFFEQGHQIMRTMSVVVDSIEKRGVELPPRPENATVLFGIPLSAILIRPRETGTVPMQIEHCLSYIDKYGMWYLGLVDYTELTYVLLCSDTRPRYIQNTGTCW